jgi:hypothetical protein
MKRIQNHHIAIGLLIVVVAFAWIRVEQAEKRTRVMERSRDGLARSYSRTLRRASEENTELKKQLAVEKFERAKTYPELRNEMALVRQETGRLRDLQRAVSIFSYKVSFQQDQLMRKEARIRELEKMIGEMNERRTFLKGAATSGGGRAYD